MRLTKRLAMWCLLLFLFSANNTHAQGFGHRSGPADSDRPFSWAEFLPPEPVPLGSHDLTRGQEIFRRNCSGCHGPNGDGRGMMARHLYPKPRDFTRGIFRFKTTQSGSLPRDSDLFRTISVGVQGTAMPTWRYTLSESQRWDLVHYLKTFSDYFSEEPPGPPVELGAETPAVKVHTERGRELYVRAGCVSCHGPDGYGDGQSAENMEDSFGFPIRPRNFHQAGEFKRGRTRQNVALTIATGNDGTPMPSFLYSLKKDEIWTLADYVMAFEVDPVAPSPMGPMNGCRMMGGRFVGGPMMGGNMRMPGCGMGRARSTEDQYVEEEPTSASRGCPMQAPNPNP